MTGKPLAVLVVGASGSVGTHVVAEALARGHDVRALVRKPGRMEEHPGFRIVTGDLTRQETLPASVEGVDAVVFAHGTYGSLGDAGAVDYGGVRNVLIALGGRRVRIALMTAIAVTDRKGAHDWKRRAERLVRASGNRYAIVRPGWFDRNRADQRTLHLLQGDLRRSGTPADGVIARADIARVLVGSLTAPAAGALTFELVAETGAPQSDLDPVFAAIDADALGALDGVHDAENMPLDREPAQVVEDLRALRATG